LIEGTFLSMKIRQLVGSISMLALLAGCGGGSKRRLGDGVGTRRRHRRGADACAYSHADRGRQRRLFAA
jgi:hypothetical protein